MENFLAKAMEAQGDTVYRLVLCRLQNIADAQDVYQDVFLRLLKQDAENWDEEHLRAWLIRVTLNRCADIGRFRIRKSTLPLCEVMEDITPDLDEAAELWDAVARLPVKLRTVLHLHYTEGYTTEEIGRILKIPSCTVRSRLFRARQKLKDMLGGCEDEEFLPKADQSDSCTK